MRRLHKFELAEAAGVHPRTLVRWMRQHAGELMRFGVTPYSKMLPPRAIAWICREYGIDIEDH